MEAIISTKTELNLAVLVDYPESDKLLPFVILLHGNTGWKEEKHIEVLSNALAAAGIATIRFDAPGSGESDGSWHKDYRVTTYIEATKEVYDWAVEHLDVDTNKVGIWGHSMGGLVAVQVASRWPELFTALCGCQPSTGKTPQSEGWKEGGGIEMQTEIFGRVWLPKEFFIDRLQYDIKEAVKTLTLPQLYIVGEYDNLVTHESVEKIFVNARDPKSLKVFPVDHFYKNDPVMLQKITDFTVRFFTKNL